MFAIASLLDPDADQQTRALWQLLEDKCGLYKIKTAPYPHYSWFGCEDLQWKPVRQKLKRISRALKCFKVQTSGIGIFSGLKPVLFVAVVKSPELLEFHQLLWHRIGENFIDPLNFYSPEHWMPHITIAQGDLTPDNLCCAVKDLAFQPLKFEILINNISIIYSNEEGVGIKEQYTLA